MGSDVQFSQRPDATRAGSAGSSRTMRETNKGDRQMTKNEQSKIRELKLAEKMVRKALANPYQYEDPWIAKSNIEFCADALARAIAEVEYLTFLLDRQES
jgi:hypothetical protein